MKFKTSPKKLNLNKQTISDLKSYEMEQIKGGFSIRLCTLPLMTCGGASFCEVCSTNVQTFCYNC